MLKKLCILFCMVFILCSCQAAETRTDVSDTTFETTTSDMTSETTTAEETTISESQGLLTQQYIEKGYILIDFPDGEFLKRFDEADTAIYKKIDRQLILEDFEALKWNMSYKEICAILGEPNGLLNHSQPIPYYELADGTYMVLYVTALTNDRSLDFYYHVDQDGNILMWKTEHLPDWQIEEGYVTYPTPEGWLAPYKEFDRELYLEDFAFITKTTNFHEIISRIGEPNGDVGSGFPRPYYILSDGTRVIFSVRGYNFPPLSFIYIDKEGNKKQIFGPDK